MAARRQNLNFVPFLKHAQANTALRRRRRRRLVQGNRKAEDRGRIEPLRRRNGGGERREAVESADPSGVKENKGNEKDYGEQNDDEEERPAADLEDPVVELCEVPGERGGNLGCRHFNRRFINRTVRIVAAEDGDGRRKQGKEFWGVFRSSVKSDIFFF